MDTNTPAPKPDMLEQAAGFLRDFIDAGAAKREPGIVPITATVLAVAAELRDIHNVLHEINGHMGFMVGLQLAAAERYGRGVDSVESMEVDA